MGAYSAIVIGTSAKAIAQEGKNENPKDAIAIGTQAEAHYASTIALGFGAKSDTKAQAVSIGYNSNAKGYQAIAFGSEAKPQIMQEARLHLVPKHKREPQHPLLLVWAQKQALMAEMRLMGLMQLP